MLGKSRPEAADKRKSKFEDMRGGGQLSDELGVLLRFDLDVGLRIIIWSHHSRLVFCFRHFSYLVVGSLRRA